MIAFRQEDERDGLSKLLDLLDFARQLLGKGLFEGLRFQLEHIITKTLEARMSHLGFSSGVALG